MTETDKDLTGLALLSRNLVNLARAPRALAGRQCSACQPMDGILRRPPSARSALMGSTCPSMDANLFVNHYGLPAAGDGPSDVVLVRSDLTPGVGPQVKAVIPAVFRTRTVTLAK